MFSLYFHGHVPCIVSIVPVAIRQLAKKLRTLLWLGMQFHYIEAQIYLRLYVYQSASVALPFNLIHLS